MKSNLDMHFKTNPNLEKAGVWFAITEEIQFLVKPFNAANTHAKAAMAKHYKPFAKQIEFDTISAERGQEIRIKMFIDACLVDWKGVKIDGVDTPYSKEIALELFMELPDLFNTLWNHCQDFKNYKDDVGNS